MAPVGLLLALMYCVGMAVCGHVSWVAGICMSLSVGAFQLTPIVMCVDQYSTFTVCIQKMIIILNMHEVCHNAHTHAHMHTHTRTHTHTHARTRTHTHT